MASRGTRYDYLRKGDPPRAGGVAKDAGIHLFKLIMRLITNVIHSGIHSSENARTGGHFALEDAGVEWFLSLDQNDLLTLYPQWKLWT